MKKKATSVPFGKRLAQREEEIRKFETDNMKDDQGFPVFDRKEAEELANKRSGITDEKSK